MSGRLSPKDEVARLTSRLTSSGIFVLIAQQHRFRSMRAPQGAALFLLRLWRGCPLGRIPCGEKFGGDERQFRDVDPTERDQSQHATNHRPEHPYDQIQHIQQYQQKAADRKQQTQRHGNRGNGGACGQHEHNGVHSEPLMGVPANHLPNVRFCGVCRQKEQSHGER